MSSNDEMYSILTPCLSLTPTPFFCFLFFFFLRASYFFEVLSAIPSLYFSLSPTRF